ncbi:toxin-antitoxin system YwqK family antitoxin [Cryomorphaceae bacterium 1068]|nr:toxin-antitoxin system YwqK family antitoxin [Cryomorphaceae bacterium 1068]
MSVRVFLPTLVLAFFVSCSVEDVPAKEVRTEPQEDEQGSDCVPMQEISYANGLAYRNETPFTGTVCSYHSNGEIHTLTSYREGKKNGLWEVFFANGQREKSGFTRQGKDDGLYREWYTNGELKYEYHYDLGKKVDVWKSWYEDGTRYTERHFENDELNGKVLVWDESGKLAKEYDYVNGRLMNSQMHFKE